jgi:cobalt/nickel transport system permease protein
MPSNFNFKQQCAKPAPNGNNMHIPDGYLSPSTCAATFVAAAPFWYVASSKVKKQLHTKALPVMAVVSAFCFVVMMFNLPLPGGTTGHAVGLGIAAIVVGPWAAVLSISLALFIQAIFFGDGGVTAFGANCLNMAIIGPFIAYWIYQLIAGKSEVASPRRVVAAGLGGYVGINVAALAAAIEFGLQPLLFRDATGAPLYAPYPLSVSIPAMLGGHLTLAGLAEAVASAGLVAALQLYEPHLLAGTAQGARNGNVPGTWRGTRGLWAGLGLFMLLSPLGLLAAGTAWGEWSAEDFADPAGRAAIATASGNFAPPANVPTGFEKLSNLWNAPFPDYAPSFIQNQNFGYILSAMMGTGLIVLIILGVQTLRTRKSSPAT